MSENRHDASGIPQPGVLDEEHKDDRSQRDRHTVGTDNGAETCLLSPQNFYEEMTAREDVREILARLARQ